MGPGFRLWPVEASLVRVKHLLHLYKHITQRMLAILNEIALRKCFAIKTTISHHIANNFTNRAPLTMNNFTMTSVLTSDMRHSFYKLY